MVFYECKMALVRSSPLLGDADIVAVTVAAGASLRLSRLHYGAARLHSGLRTPQNLTAVGRWRPRRLAAGPLEHMDMGDQQA
eukprot:SAG25_NODE_45_length_19261_cov_61.009815_11_plen_82_part_00